jgi:hypothetical protein
MAAMDMTEPRLPGARPRRGQCKVAGEYAVTKDSPQKRLRSGRHGLTPTSRRDPRRGQRQGAREYVDGATRWQDGGKSKQGGVIAVSTPCCSHVDLTD